MKLKVLLSFVFLISIFNLLADQQSPNTNHLNTPNPEVTNPDSLMHRLFADTIHSPAPASLKTQTLGNSTESKPINIPVKVDKPIEQADTVVPYVIPPKTVQVHVDSLIFQANPFFIELVYKGLPFDFKWNPQPDFQTLYYGTKAKTLSQGIFKPVIPQTTEQIVYDLREYTREQIIRNAADLYVMTFDELPDPDIYKSHLIKEKSLKNIRFITDDPYLKRRRIIVKREQMGPWQYKANGLAQFSQNYVSPNWYQGGNSNLAILGILSGQLNYDNKKSIQWENSAEWHMGFNSISGDSLRMLSTNDDIFKINSKLGIKASGNWFYSTTVDFSTQFFNSYNGINSMVMKTSFLTPVRLNVGVGLDYKYKKIFSFMFSPISYKYIFVEDTKNVDPNLFGIKSGQNTLSEVGSSFNSTFSYPLTKEIQLDSKLNFYSNYKTIEADLEVVCNMTINRFMSTRISFNPHYDNSVILGPGQIAKMQLKQLLSVGFSHKFY